MMDVHSGQDVGVDDDVRYLERLGYKQQLSRVMGIWPNFALGFTYLSPVVGIYTLYAYSLGTGGGAMFWAIPIVVAGQLMVVLVFGEVVSQYPIAGGIYQWARRLNGRGYGWFTAWMYTWALLVTVAAVAYGAGPYVADLFGANSTKWFVIGTAIVLIAIASVINLFGARLLSKAAVVGLVAEIIGAVVIGFYLLVFKHREAWSVLVHHQGAVTGSGGYAGAFLAAGLMAIWIFYGFEACGDVAEEVKNPSRRIPRAMLMTLGVGAGVSAFLVLALTLSVPSITAVTSGKDTDPVNTVFTASFGNFAHKLALLVIVLAFISCTLAIQAAAARLLFSQGRDGVVPGSSLLSRVSPRFHMSPWSVAVAFVIPSAIILATYNSPSALTKIIDFATVGIYIGFQLVVLAALMARSRGWKPAGAFSLGQWGLPVNIVALAYGVGAIINLSWPRTPGATWYNNYIVIVSALAVAAIGVIYMILLRPHQKGDSPAGDAAPSTATAAAVSS
jgi:amino acid transporter